MHMLVERAVGEADHPTEIDTSRVHGYAVRAFKPRLNRRDGET